MQGGAACKLSAKLWPRGDEKFLLPTEKVPLQSLPALHWWPPQAVPQEGMCLWEQGSGLG